MNLRLTMIFFLWLSAFAHAKEPTEKLAAAVDERISRVAEIEMIRKKAESMGLRAWALGGTAAGLLHYVRWDLQREGGDKSLNAARFDYSFANIYRYNQDFDLVIDGTAAQAEGLETWLKSELGADVKWEVRCLKEDRGEKQKLIGNPDIAGQNIDTNSIGLIELTRPKDGEPRIRDYLDWSGKRSVFLEDGAAGIDGFLRSPTHKKTKRYKEGNNPEIFSVILYYKKLLQYGLEPKPEDRKKIEAILRDFDPGSFPKGGYARSWLVSNALKMVQNAVDKEAAWKLLDEVSLREKLVGLGDETLTTWLEREPFRSRPLGKKGGKTARELGISEVAHSTKDYFAVEDITWNPSGKVNAFISRQGKAGEAASLGDGFYVLKGDVGVGREEFSIHLILHPDAREGADFVVRGNELLVKNASAIRVSDRSLARDPVELFQMLAARKGTKPPQGKSTDAVLSRWRRKISLKIKELAPLALEQAKQKELNYDFFTEWFSAPGSSAFPEVLSRIIKAAVAAKNPRPLNYAVTFILKQPQFGGWQASFVELVNAAKKFKDPAVLSNTIGVAAMDIFSEDRIPGWRDALNLIIDENAKLEKPSTHTYQNLIEHVFKFPWAAGLEPELVRLIENCRVLLKSGEVYGVQRFILTEMTNYVLSRPHGETFTRAMNAILALVAEHPELTDARHGLERLQRDSKAWRSYAPLTSYVSGCKDALERL